MSSGNWFNCIPALPCRHLQSRNHMWYLGMPRRRRTSLRPRCCFAWRKSLSSLRSIGYR